MSETLNWKASAKRWRRIAKSSDKQRHRQNELLRRAGVSIGVRGRVTLELLREEAAATLFEAQAALLTEGLARDHLRSLGQRLSDAIADYAAVQRSGWSAEAEAGPIRLAYMAALRDFRAAIAAIEGSKE